MSISEEKLNILDVLPAEDYVYKLMAPKEHTISKYVGEIRCNINSKEGALAWVHLFEESSVTNWRVRKTFPENTGQIIFKKVFRCHHNTLPDKGSKPAEKNTDCPASLIITVKDKNMKWSLDEYLQELPCSLYLRHEHNHPLQAADVLRHRRPDQTVKEKFSEMFKNGHSPSSAMSSHKFDLQREHGDKYFEVAADGAKCPKLNWAYKLYYSIFGKEYGGSNGQGMISSLKEFIDKYNRDCGETCAILNFDNDKPDELAVAICSPLMKRVHRLHKASGEICFVDSSGSMDRHNTRVFTFLTPSVAGGLPLGIIMTFSESTKAIKIGLELLTSLLPEKSFYGKEQNGPAIFMTDDCSSLRKALHTVFPDATLLLCKFHVLQALWRFLWDSVNKVSKEHRVVIFNCFKTALNANKQSEFESAVKSMLENPTVTKYPKVVAHLKSLQPRAEEWALCFRKNMLTREHHTNNYAEAGFRVLKDKVFRRLKAYSIVQSFDFLTTRFHLYLEQRIIDTNNNKTENYVKSRYFMPLTKLNGLECHQLTIGAFTVCNKIKGTEYNVDMTAEMCSCPVGNTGAPCKHQFAVARSFNLFTTQFLPFADQLTKEILHQIVYGEGKIPPSDWYSNLHDNSVTTAVYSGPASKDMVVSESIDNETNETNSISPVDDKDPNLSNDDDDSSVRNITAEDIHECEKGLEEMFNILKQKLQQNKEEYVPAIKKTLQTFKKCTQDSTLVSALHTFGKLVTNHKARTIRVQPTAPSRRVIPVDGRTTTQTGRPSKEVAQSAKRKGDPTWAQPPIKRRATHSLSQCVQSGTSIGRNHQKK